MVNLVPLADEIAVDPGAGLCVEVGGTCVDVVAAGLDVVVMRVDEDAVPVQISR